MKTSSIRKVKHFELFQNFEMMTIFGRFTFGTAIETLKLCSEVELESLKKHHATIYIYRIFLNLGQLIPLVVT